MGWRDLPIWFKGGIIGAVGLFLLYVFLVYNPFGRTGNPEGLFVIMLVLAAPLLLIVPDLLNTNAGFIYFFIFNFFSITIMGFIFGAVIGRIVQAIKNKKSIFPYILIAVIGLLILLGFCSQIRYWMWNTGPYNLITYVGFLFSFLISIGIVYLGYRIIKSNKE